MASILGIANLSPSCAQPSLLWRWRTCAQVPREWPDGKYKRMRVLWATQGACGSVPTMSLCLWKQTLLQPWPLSGESACISTSLKWMELFLAGAKPSSLLLWPQPHVPEDGGYPSLSGDGSMVLTLPQPKPAMDLACQMLSQSLSG